MSFFSLEMEKKFTFLAGIKAQFAAAGYLFKAPRFLSCGRLAIL
jgi:hypothetical protein